MTASPMLFCVTSSVSLSRRRYCSFLSRRSAVISLGVHGNPAWGLLPQLSCLIAIQPPLGLSLKTVNFGQAELRLPRARAQGDGRIIDEDAAQRRRALPVPAARDAEAPDALRALHLGRGRGAPVDARESLQLQQIAALEVEEEQRRARLSRQVSQRVEVAVAAKIGDQKRVGLDMREARPAAAMGDVGAPGRSDVGA